MPSDLRQVEALLDLAGDAQRALDLALGGREFDPSGRSRLPGWSVGHVLTHIARNADSHAEMLAGFPQYGGSFERRNLDIEVGAGRTRDELIEDVAASSARLGAAWSAVDDWESTAQTLRGAAIARRDLLLLRAREVLIHWIDLDLGFEFDDLPAEYVRRDLRQLEMAYTSRLPMGLTGLPSAALGAPAARRLGWLLGRDSIEGAGDADPA